jgi:hypothetical protein
MRLSLRRVAYVAVVERREVGNRVRFGRDDKSTKWLEIKVATNLSSRPKRSESVNSAKGDQRLKAYLESQSFPHYEAHPDKAGLLIRIDEDGRRTTGRFVNRQFHAVRPSKRAAAK